MLPRLFSAGMGILFLAIAAPVWGVSLDVAGPGDPLGTDSLSTPASFAKEDTLIALFKLSDVFTPDASLGNGIPATVILVVDLWRERSGWWDSLVRSQAFSYRFRRNLWNGTYEFWGLDRSHSEVSDQEHLKAILERVHEVVLGTPKDFEPGKRYYLTVKALVQPMNLDDLQRIDAWLSGNVTGSGGGGLLGIPKSLARVVVDVSGLGDQNAIGKSRVFLPRP